MDVRVQGNRQFINPALLELSTLGITPYSSTGTCRRIEIRLKAESFAQDSIESIKPQKNSRVLHKLFYLASILRIADGTLKL